ncbi:MAG TPA: rod shape-determining protein [Anaerolineaceae bacterium]|nr:rod shape-determining protein [Anaerolineaceae bacterium]
MKLRLKSSPICSRLASAWQVGGAQLQGLTERLCDELHLRVWAAEDPLTCVVRGASMILDNIDIYSRFLVGLDRNSNRKN